ncbi:hypothetical protein MLD38_035275 [Melastoma candidum]|uniref:Uncharacterized protein n=1 Tax=Melastoma candidum TaxID=119954 RepID=A0ACB9MCR6_9MYRT|nr:hypothetical protein MLD38_035275 [Melastoma candidum]
MKLACCWIPAIVGDIFVNIRGIFGFSFTGFRRAMLGVFTCIFALGITPSSHWLYMPFVLITCTLIPSLFLARTPGGAIVGIITGALKGQTTETGFVRGAGIGAVTGAVTAVQLLELVINGESLSKVALICSLVDGKVFMEWVGPAVLKAYQWQVSTFETGYTEVSDIYDTEDSVKGLSQDCINRLPVSLFAVPSSDQGNDSCSICLQDFEGGEYGRRLPNCGHMFHLGCLDSWLIRSGSCPMCRDRVHDNDDDHRF